MKVTEKFQVAIPKEVREEIGLKPGEIVMVERVGEEEILVKFRGLGDPLKLLIGKMPFTRYIPVEELEEKAELR